MIGARIRQARLRAGLSLDALRDALGNLGCSITKASLSKYERDESRVPATMLFKLAQSAAKGWRKLRGHQHIPDLIQGIRFIDGVNEHHVKQQDTSSPKTRTTHTETVA